MMKVSWILVIVLLKLAYEDVGVSGAVIDPILTLLQGKIKGGLVVSRNGKNFVQYLGIPYAKKPERFKEAGAPPKWDGFRDGTKFGSVCPQFDRKTKGVIGDEDCLFLNVYTPQMPSGETFQVTSTTAKTLSGGLTRTTGNPLAASLTPSTKSGTSAGVKRPVIVHIHGGSFVAQSGEVFGPNYLLDEDVILVTFNYRLSVFGFLSTGDKEMPANLGLRDQILALKWVRDNIGAFGGDSSRVTVYGGSSAGGAMASYLTLSPMAKGLFANVISSSGNALCPWAVVRNPGSIATKLGTKLNCPNTKTSSGILACLRVKSIKDIEIARVSLQGFAEDPAVPFAPVVESWLAKEPTIPAVVPDTPEKLLIEGKFSQVPWMTGINSLNSLNLAVGNLITTPKRLTQLDQEWSKLAPSMLHFSQTAKEPAKLAQRIRTSYFGSKPINNETLDELISAFNDRNWITCTAKAASLQSRFSPVYLYYMTFKGQSSFWDDWGLREKFDVQGPVHGDELQHLFNSKSPSFPPIKKGDKMYYAFSEKMVKLWTSFAKTGKPLEISTSSNVAAEWSPVLAGTQNSKLRWNKLEAGEGGSTGALEQSVKFDLWDSLDLGEAPVGAVAPAAFTVGFASTPKPSPITPLKSGLGTPPPVPPRLSSPIPPPLPPRPSSPTSPPVPPRASSAKPVLPASSPSTSIFQSTSKPGDKASSPSPLLANYGVTPGTVKSSSSKPVSPSPTPAVSSSSPIPPSNIGVLFNDDDGPSSSTTTTTKKPGFLSKLFG